MHADRFHVGVAMLAVAAVRPFRVALQLLIEVALAGEVMVDADDVRSGIGLQEEVEFLFSDAVLDQDLAPGMMAVDPSAQEIEAEPAALVFQIGLVSQKRCAERLPEILGLYELGVGRHASDRAHRQYGGRAFGDKRSQERRLALSVRIPMAVEAAEAGRRERLVHRSEHLDPRITPRDTLSVARQKAREGGIEEIRVAWPTPVMHKPGNGPDVQFVHSGETRIGPAPVADVRIVGGHGFPNGRVAQGANPERPNHIEVPDPLPITVSPHLIPEAAPDPHGGEFEPPQNPKSIPPG